MNDNDEPIGSPPTPPAGKSNKKRTNPPAQGGDVPPLSKAEIAQQDQEQRLRPFVERLQGVEPGGFKTELDSIVKKLKSERTRRGLHQILQAALRHIAASQSGAIVVRHFQFRSEWTKADIEYAVQGLIAAVRARGPELPQLGPVIHGALICLVDAAQKQEGLDGARGDNVDLIAALLQLHAATWEESRAPLIGLAEPPVAQVLCKAAAILCRFPGRGDVQAIRGQRLFGFDEPFVLPSTAPSDSTLDPQASQKRCIESAVPSTAARVESQAVDTGRSASASVASPMSGGDTPHQSGAGAATKDELSKLRKQLESAKRDLGIARRVRDAEQQSSAGLRRQLDAMSAMRDDLSEKMIRLQDELESAGTLKLELATLREEHSQAQAENARLHDSRKVAEVQAKAAMESEFERGKVVARATIKTHFVEPLRQVSDSAAAIEGDAGNFVRDMANSLRKYLEEGRG